MRKILPLAGAVAISALLLAWSARRHAEPTAATAVAPPPKDPTYTTAIQPIFDRRCVPCHACFDSPCQLTLQSFEGLDRGGNKAVVYHPERPVQAPPTRMFQDAQTTAAWQAQLGFFPVVDRTGAGDLGSSILWRFVKQRMDAPGGGTFDVDQATVCPRDVAEVEGELREHPERGMPFGFPPLDPRERETLAAWLHRGAGGSPADPAEEEAAKRATATWETFFNGGDPRAPLVSAYLFEHLFYAHLYFSDGPGPNTPGSNTPASDGPRVDVPRAWFRLVRSRTPSGVPIDEIPTRRPSDDPGTALFYYRLRRIHETLVLKTHAPYALSDAKLARLRALFYDSPWAGGGPWALDRSSGNPFVTFAAIPPPARYQFLLDDAHYHVQTFIHGPVCRGQAALDVIDEHFLLFFLAPESDPAVTDPGYLAQIAPDLELPAEKGESIAALSPSFDAKELRYLRAEAPHARSRTLSDVWHGDGSNPDAVLTVFRHHDNAFVLRGALGGMPKTVWVLDYPTFERMYYDLVAGFDVYGNVTHQIATREYMNFLRIEAEGQFLRLLPASERERVFGEWYRGRVAHKLAGIHAGASEGPEVGIAFVDRARAKEEIVTRLLTKELPAAVVGLRDPIQWPDVEFASDPLRARFEHAMRDVARKRGPSVGPFPDTTLLRVKSAGQEDLVYTIARNRSHASVEFIFAEGVELEPSEDTLQIVSGIASSRPNLLLVVDEQDLDAFVAAWKALKQGDGSWSAFVARWAARRGDPAFWSTFDSFTAAGRALDPIGSAVLDLSRYSND